MICGIFNKALGTGRLIVIMPPLNTDAMAYDPPPLFSTEMLLKYCNIAVTLEAYQFVLLLDKIMWKFCKIHCFMGNLLLPNDKSMLVPHILVLQISGVLV